MIARAIDQKKGTRKTREGPSRNEGPSDASIDPYGGIAKLDRALRWLGERAARRFGHDADDGWQAAREAALVHLRRGLRGREVLRLVEADLFRPRSTMRYRPQDRPSGSIVAAGIAPGVSLEWGWLRHARAGEIGLAARLLAPSSAGPHLDRLLREARLRCPACRGRGHWASWGEVNPDRGVQQTGRQRAAVIRDVLEPGQTTVGTDVGEPVPAVAGMDVWLCDRCACWTREPLAVLTQERADDLSVLPRHAAGGVHDVDGRLYAYIEGRLACYDADEAEDYLDALTGGVAANDEDAWIEHIDRRRCDDAEEAEATSAAKPDRRARETRP